MLSPKVGPTSISQKVQKNDLPMSFVVPDSENEIEIAQYIYELILLSFPINFIHPDDEDGFSTCNEEMMQKLESHSEPEVIDPRWNELKKLIDNK